MVSQYRTGSVDFSRLATIERLMPQQSDQQARARAQTAIGLIQVYRALGAGWQIRLGQTGLSSLPQPPVAPRKVRYRFRTWKERTNWEA